MTDFRSVKDSGWIDTDDVTALIGANESGKTNLLIPLWKLNPAKGGEIKVLSDYPRAAYNQLRGAAKQPTFIRARFAPDAALAKQLATATGLTTEDFDEIEVSRDFNGERSVAFPSVRTRRAEKAPLVSLLAQMANDLEGDGSAAVLEREPRNAAMKAIGVALTLLRGASEALTLAELENVRKVLAVSTSDAPTSVVQPRLKRCADEIARVTATLTMKDPNVNEAAVGIVTANLPAFVYYSSYGNLDSEIYLPHVLDNMKRSDLGAKEEAKVRTLKVLFEFVRLSPEEILELGKDARNAHEPAEPPTAAEIEATAEKKKERDILLRSADTQLTHEFRTWWQQGNYRFRFAADGDHFRIWVSDDLRPEEVELELRSTGLQWFLSFFLVFLVESKDSHKGSILLLDEPGQSLHPIAQKDLSRFFDNLSKTNQLLYTTHSPFLVDADRLDRVRAVFIDDKGTTRVSPDLRASPAAQSPEARSVYAVHAALGLTVSDALLQGCAPVIVEGQSDQHYLSAIKTLLIGAGRIQPNRELLFLPAGGFKGVTALVAILCGKEESLPAVVVDSDNPGLEMAKKLEHGQYRDAKERITRIGELISLESAEVEDVMPTSIMVDIVSRTWRADDEDFSDAHVNGKPIVPQIEAFAAKHKLKLAEGWKVDLARNVKSRLLRAKASDIAAMLDVWARLFARFA